MSYDASIGGTFSFMGNIDDEFTVDLTSRFSSSKTTFCPITSYAHSGLTVSVVASSSNLGFDASTGIFSFTTIDVDVTYSLNMKVCGGNSV